MATITGLGATLNTTSGTKAVTATPAVDDLIVIVTMHTGNTSDNAPTDNNSGGGGTYTEVETRVKNTSADKIKMWIRDSLITSATSTTFTHAPGSSSGGGIFPYGVSGMSRVGSAAKAKSGGQDDASAGTPSFSWTGGGSANTNNPVIAFVFNASNPAAVEPPTNLSETGDTGYGTPTTGVEVARADSGFTASTVAWTSSSATAFAAVALELDTSAAPTGTHPGWSQKGGWW